MPYEGEVALLKQFVTDLQRVSELGKKHGTAGTKEHRALLISLHQRTAAMKRAVARSGVSSVVHVDPRLVRPGAPQPSAAASI